MKALYDELIHMTGSKDLLPVAVKESPKSHRGVFWAVLKRVKSLVGSKLTKTNGSEKIEKEKSLLFNLNWIEDLEIAGKILDQMSDDEVLWDSDKKSLIKYFHPDIPNLEWENFSSEVRRLIFLRVHSIQEAWKETKVSNSSKNNWRNWNTYNYQWRTYYSSHLYEHTSKKVTWIMTKAINDISNSSESILKVVELTLKYLQELLEDINEERVNKDLLLTMRKQVEKILFSNNIFSIGDLPKEINCEKILDIIANIEDISWIFCRRTKRSILVYYANCWLLRHHDPKRLRERINYLGRKYWINTQDIWKNVTHVAKWPKKFKTNDPNRLYLNRNSTPRSFKK